jgi:hypothetical protein
MLADSIQVANPPVGNLRADVHAPATLLYELLDFIAAELPRWRDREERLGSPGENALTAQLCSHLNSAARISLGWDILQFRREEPDEAKPARAIDLVAAPCGVRVWMHGQCFYDFQSLLPIECKRLPTPKNKKRDEREYVFTKYGSTGGIQRYKAGHHGARHTLGGMIAYVQDETIETWCGRLNTWIRDLSRTKKSNWSISDVLHLQLNDGIKRIAVCRSVHTRDGLPDIELRHLWVVMSCKEGV